MHMRGETVGQSFEENPPEPVDKTDGQSPKRQEVWLIWEQGKQRIIWMVEVSTVHVRGGIKRSNNRLKALDRGDCQI